MGYPLKTLDGKIINVDIRPSKYPMRAEADCKSNAQFRFGKRMRKCFPFSVILEEFSIPESGGLSLDFWLPAERLAFEIQGGQHRKFSKFHHGNIMGFHAQRARDQRKKTWCEINNIKLVTIDDNKVDSANIVDLVNDKKEG